MYKKTFALTTAAMLYGTTVLAVTPGTPATVDDLVQSLINENLYSEIKIQRGLFSVTIKAEGDGVERKIILRDGQVVSDESESDDGDDDENDDEDDDDENDDDESDDDESDDDEDDDEDDDDDSEDDSEDDSDDSEDDED